MTEFARVQMQEEECLRPYAILHVVKAEGCHPGTVGKKMLLRSDGSFFGTLGGGATEWAAAREAGEVLAGGGASYLREYDDQPDRNEAGFDTQCAHHVWIYAEMFRPPLTLVVCGGGHLGRNVLKLAGYLGFYTVLLEKNAELAQNPDAARSICCGNYKEGLAQAGLPEGAYYYLATDSHASDAEALSGVFARDFAYVGMVGSRLKLKQVREWLTGEGVDPALFDRLHCPVGLNIASSDPKELALAVMAEILMVKNGKEA